MLNLENHPPALGDSIKELLLLSSSFDVSLSTMCECECHCNCKKEIPRLWKLLNSNSSAIQALCAIFGLILIVYGYSAYRIESRKFNLDYGKQSELTLSGSSLYAKRFNELISDIRVETTAYLRISDERFSITKPQYIKIPNYLICVGRYLGDSICEVENILQSPRRDTAHIDDLEIIFNETPTKVWANPVCISSLEYTDPQNNRVKKNYFTENCGLNYYSWYPPAHYLISDKEIAEKIPTVKVIGEIDFSKVNKLAFADPKFTKKLLTLLGKYRWHQRVTEDPQITWWRTIHLYGNNDNQKYLDFINENVEF